MNGEMNDLPQAAFHAAALRRHIDKTGCRVKQGKGSVPA
jgi:hypothetical protein